MSDRASTLKNICFTRIMNSINTGATVDLGSLPPHLANEIISSIQMPDILRRIHKANADYPNVISMCNIAWLVFINKEFLHGKATDDLLQEGETWFDYYNKLKEKEDKEYEELKSKPIEKVKKESKIIEGAKKDRIKAKISQSKTTPWYQQRTETNPYIKALYRHFH